MCGYKKKKHWSDIQGSIGKILWKYKANQEKERNSFACVKVSEHAIEEEILMWYVYPMEFWSNFKIADSAWATFQIFLHIVKCRLIEWLLQAEFLQI